MGRPFAVVCTALLCLVAAEATASADDYGPTTSGIYQDQGEGLEPVLFQPRFSTPYDRLNDGEYWKEDLFLFKLWKSLQQGEPSHDESESKRYGQSTPEHEDLESSWRDAVEVKDSDVKRWVTSLNSSVSSKASKAETARLQRKWKIKKGKGLPSLCYFKLCSFRRYR